MFHNVAHYSSQKEPRHIGLPNLSVKVSQNEQCCPSIPPFSAFVLARLAAGSSQQSAVLVCCGKDRVEFGLRRVFADLAGDQIRDTKSYAVIVPADLLFLPISIVNDRNRQKSATFDNC